MPVFRWFDKVFDSARSAKVFLNSRAGITRGALPDGGQYEKQTEDAESVRRHVSEQEQKIKSKKQELGRISAELQAAKERGKRSEQVEQTKRAKRKQQEIFQLEMELRNAEERTEGAADDWSATQATGEEPELGALPDFAIIGAAKSGTTFFHHLLTLHPHVEPAAFKEPHYFDVLFEEEGVKWYRRCFPPPRWKDGHRTITGDGTPGYLFHPRAPERMAAVVPQARLIALLRNPVERTYSAYHHRVRNGVEPRTFERAIKEVLEAEEARPFCEEDEPPKHEDSAALDYYSRRAYLFNSIYVDHLLRWSEFFPKEQMLVLKSEDFFERPREALEPVLDFLGLPDWEPTDSELRERRNEGKYGQGMDPATRRRLEEFFEPHNRRLYEYLGKDLGW